jgi:ribosome maturation factor RimP
MAATASQSRLVATIRDLVEPVVTGAGVDLVDLEIKGPPNRRVVRVVADVDGGLDIDRIATVSQQVSAALDDADAIPGAYTLEVSSPGVDRPLTTGHDFARQLGRHVRIVRVGADDLVGTLRGATDDVVTVEIDGDEQTIAIADVDHGRVELPW